jgi:endoglucanase
MSEMESSMSSVHRFITGPALQATGKGAFLVVVGMALAAGGATAAPPGTTTFGVYDPGGAYAADAQVSIEHIFLPWEGVDLGSLRAADGYARQRNRSILVTIEPWIWGEPSSAETLRRAVLSGRHDATMRSVCSVLGTLQSPVTVRWAQEMDNPNGHFPWAMWQPADHIAAYRRMVGVCRAVAPDLQYMWSPAGEEGMEAYFPGNDVVDMIGLSVFGSQDFHRTRFGTDGNFAEVLAPRYDRALPFGLPIVNAELGYVGDAAYINDWHRTVRQPSERFSELVAVIYFNRQEVYPWPDYSLPDWRDGARLDN